MPTPEEMKDIIFNRIMDDNEIAFGVWKKIIRAKDTVELAKIKHKIVKGNDDIQRILFAIVSDQFEEHKYDIESAKNEGFHVPQPWNGDIVNAPVLILSSNPGFTLGAISPRYFGNGKFRWCGKISNQQVISIKEVKDFFDNRFEEASPRYPYSVITPSGKFTVALEPIQTKTKVNYWNGMFTFLKDLFVMKKDRAESNEDFAKRVMRKGVCTEIVPFVSRNEKPLKEDPKLIKYCWENFSRSILNLSNASLFVLSGEQARNTFLEAAFTDVDNKVLFYKNENGNYMPIENQADAEEKFTQGDANQNAAILEYRSNGKIAKIITVDHLSYYGRATDLPKVDFPTLRNALGL